MKLFGREFTKSDFMPPILIKVLIKLGFLKNIKSANDHFYHEVLKTYSQFHEDLIIDNLLACKKDGFYVDVGANHPTELSNTKKFYDRGWNGINIEPNPILIKGLIEQRKRDLNLNIGIAPEKGELTFYLLSADTLSTFDYKSAQLNARIHGEKIKSELSVKVSQLKEVLEKNNVKEIDFMSVDTEGFDLAVLQSNDWFKFRPKLLIVEINQGGEDILDYMKENQYSVCYKNPTNAILMDNNISF